MRGRILPALAAMLWITFPAPAQEATASLTGAVVDQTGASIAHAAVELDSSTRKYQVQADGAGVYRFSNLPAREYTLTFQAMGFKTLAVESIQLAGWEQKRISDIMLDVGEIAAGCGSQYPPAFRLLAGETAFGGLAGSVIRDGGPPLEGVDVTLVCRTFSACASTRTDSNGRFWFGMLSPGEYGLSLRRVGFYPVAARGYYFRVKAGLESAYGPQDLERCPNGNCDPKLKPPSPPVQVHVCQ